MTGYPEGKAFSENREGFHIKIDDPTLTGVANAQVTVISESADGREIDRIPLVEMSELTPGDPTHLISGTIKRRRKTENGTTVTTQQGRQITVVADVVDDGQKRAEEYAPGSSPLFPTISTGGFFDADERKPTDRTILTSVGVGPNGAGLVGGQLRIEYSNTQPAANAAPADIQKEPFKPIPICEPSLKRYLRVKIFNLSQVDEQNVLPAWIQQAREVWANACVELDITVEPLPAARRADLLALARPVDNTTEPFATNSRILVRSLSQNWRNIMNWTRDPAAPLDELRKEIVVYLIKSVKNPQNNREHAGGQAFTDTGSVEKPSKNADIPEYRKALEASRVIDPNNVRYRGVAYVVTDPVTPESGGTAPGASGRDIAHEIAHFIFGPTHDPDNKVNILFGDRVYPGSLLQKRFDENQRRGLQKEQISGEPGPNRFLQRRTP